MRVRAELKSFCEHRQLTMFIPCQWHSVASHPAGEYSGDRLPGAWFVDVYIYVIHRIRESDFNPLP